MPAITQKDKYGQTVEIGTGMVYMQDSDFPWTTYKSAKMWNRIVKIKISRNSLRKDNSEEKDADTTIIAAWENEWIADKLKTLQYGDTVFYIGTVHTRDWNGPNGKTTYETIMLSWLQEEHTGSPNFFEKVKSKSMQGSNNTKPINDKDTPRF